MDLSFSPASVGFLVGLFLDPEDEGHKFLRNVGLSPNYTVLESETQLSLPFPSAGCLLRLIFDPDDRGNMLLRNVGHSPNYMALQTRRQSQS
jgi:hypothetical protein